MAPFPPAPPTAKSLLTSTNDTVWPSAGPGDAGERNDVVATSTARGAKGRLIAPHTLASKSGATIRAITEPEWGKAPVSILARGAAHGRRLARELEALARVPDGGAVHLEDGHVAVGVVAHVEVLAVGAEDDALGQAAHFEDRKSTRLNSSHRCTSYAVFCLKKKRMTYL